MKQLNTFISVSGVELPEKVILGSIARFYNYNIVAIMLLNVEGLFSYLKYTLIIFR